MISGVAFVVALVFGVLPSLAQRFNAPHAAYAYPAGGQQGTTFRLTVGGQFLTSVAGVRVSGEGIEAAILEHNRPLTPKEFNDLRMDLRALQDKRQAGRQSASSTNRWTAADAEMLTDIRDRLLKHPPNRQVSPALAETVELSVTIATNAEPGERELRLTGPAGWSNPLVFNVGQLKEYSRPLAKTANPEVERFLASLGRRLPADTPAAETQVDLPATVNGQVLPGAVHRYRFRARQGQQLVIRMSARRLMPYLADAVPGWFEAAATLYDDKGAELAFGERYRFRPDPVLHCGIPKDGEYVVEVRDSLYRGREDFVYRMTMGELPFVTSIFPLGAPQGAKTTVELTGWNLPSRRLELDHRQRSPGTYSRRVQRDQWRSNPVRVAVDTLPERSEKEPNNRPETAQAITLPVIINGRIDRPGDWDVFRFHGVAGQQVVAEVLARRLDSPLDSVLKLTDHTGQQLAFNDDSDDRGAGLETHHADSYLTVVLPANGTYYLHLGDAQGGGGPDYAYRLRVSAPRPDFELLLAPSTVNLRLGTPVPITVYALRRDGFTNAIALRLKGAPPGVTLNPSQVGAGQDQAQLSLRCPAQAPAGPIDLAIEGKAVLDGHELVRTAAPADEMMQAFAYRHLVPAQELTAVIMERARFGPDAVRLLSATPLRIPVGGIGRIRLGTPSSAFADRFEIGLEGAPEGLAIQNLLPTGEGLEVVLRCGEAEPKAGVEGSLKLSFRLRQNQSGPATARPRAGPAGLGAGAALPAIPFAIVASQ